MMHTMERVFPDGQTKTKEFDSATEDDKVCKVILKLVGEVQPTDHHYLQVGKNNLACTYFVVERKWG
jgi:hypothetical protein